MSQFPGSKGVCAGQFLIDILEKTDFINQIRKTV